MGPAGPSAGLVNLDMEGDQGAGSSVPTLGPWGVEVSVLMVSEWEGDGLDCVASGC